VNILLRLVPLRFLAIAAAMAAVVSPVMADPTVLDSAVNPANGHTYYLLSLSDWTNAENAAIALGGHLATIRNLAENNWVWDRWGTNRTLWIGLNDPVTGDGGGTQHATDFNWSSGETSSYRNWRSGEPNGDDYAIIMPKAFAGGGQWNDIPNVTNSSGLPTLCGVAEVPVCTPHAAKATATLFNNFVVGATITDTGCGYTNAPTVTISGGGGSGATATATINANGVVTAVNIISAGSGYTNTPQIIITSPPFVPTVSIAVSKVLVTGHVQLGFNYVFDASSNLVNWAAATSSFTATNEYMSSEFDVNATGRYFRVRQVP
jgi:hypothetical protein